LLGETLAEEDQPDLQLMLYFSTLNLLLDIVNVFCFAKADQAIGLPTVSYTDIHHSPPSDGDSGVHDVEEFENRRDSQRTIKMTNTASEGETTALLDTKLSPSTTSSSPILSSRVKTNGVELQQMEGREYTVSTKTSYGAESNNHRYSADESDERSSAYNTACEAVSDNDTISTSGDFHGTLELNLNMCSAWTHVCADTLRSTAVLIAAAFASLAPDVSPDSADATAAVVVSVIIIISLGPLVQGLYLTAVEIWTIQKEDKQRQAAAAKEATEVSLTL